MATCVFLDDTLGRAGRVWGPHSATTAPLRQPAAPARSLMLSQKTNGDGSEHGSTLQETRAAGSTDDGTDDEDGGVSRASTPLSTGVRRD